MKISTGKSHKKNITLIGIFVILIFTASYTAVAYFKPLWPFASLDQESSNQQKTSGGDETKKNNPDLSTDDSNTGQSPPNTTNDKPNYVDTPITKPESNASFPIENARWRIDQTTPTSYEITLFAIANNTTQYGGYTDQLRVFKKEALRYLSDRYGDITKFTFKWNPSDAANL